MTNVDALLAPGVPAICTQRSNHSNSSCVMKRKQTKLRSQIPETEEKRKKQSQRIKKNGYLLNWHTGSRLIGIYFGFSYEKKVDITFEIASELS
jgi:hypothetical protein